MGRHHSELEWREYQQRGPGMFVAINWWHTLKGFQLSVERRRNGLATPGKVRCIRCADARELLAAVDSLARTIAADPPPSLHVTVADNLDAGVTCRAALVLLAAMQQSEDVPLAA